MNEFFTALAENRAMVGDYWLGSHMRPKAVAPFLRNQPLPAPLHWVQTYKGVYFGEGVIRTYSELLDVVDQEYTMEVVLINLPRVLTIHWRYEYHEYCNYKAAYLQLAEIGRLFK